MSKARPDGVDRRRAERKPATALRAQLLMELDSTVRSLSTRGMMVRVASPPALGTTHTFVLTFESVTLRVAGLVKYVNPVTQEGPPRYDVGVEFEDVDPAAREYLERFVGRHVPE